MIDWKYQRDLENSRYNFEHYIAPYIKNWLNLKSIRIVEKHKTQKDWKKDILEVIDSEGIDKDDKKITMTSKVQFGDRIKKRSEKKYNKYIRDNGYKTFQLI